jgi:rhamnosyltransferase
MPKVSIIMRVYNEMPYIKYALRKLKQQSFQDYELIVVDSGSTDGSYQLAEKINPDIIYQIPAGSYVPGRVLNEAISKASGEIIVFNNSDCIPQNDYWLENLIRPFEQDKHTIAVFANQVPRPEASPLVRKDYERAFGDGAISSKWKHFFSLASSAVKRDIILQYPFNPTIQYSEDIEWSWRMRQLGKKITYVPDAIVEHSHNYTWKGLIKRYTGEGNAEKEIYKEKRGMFVKAVILSASVEFIRDALYLMKHREPQWIPYAFGVRYLQRYCVWKARA